ncbi:thiamine transport system substrate-binding protein [Mesocricetibacter intestinalis]|uniref:Thiamine-binding periplasmic protein n=1 Tax=Mesocricetibacter intestinalis TaxID=1521930 RepID=A0A4R6VLY9_9PAST|nr:thiamine ABC transporter substrate binding subunit [Mesocricetibacter intestinalis]TDQ59860.1 thiamine transport system substrate-binding protein [Mesocricetibacter intestinalis]
MFKIKSLVFLTALSLPFSALSAPTEINVYAEEFFSAQWGPGIEVKKMFERETPQCRLNLVPFDSRSTMLNRLRLEGKKSKADVVVGLDNHQLEAARQSGLFGANKVSLEAISLPIKWQDSTFLPYDFGQYAFIYDKTKLKNPPQSLQELIEREDLQIIYQDPRTSSIGRGLVVWVNSLYPPQQTEKIWRRLATHTLTVGKGWSETYGVFLKGEGDLVLSHSTSPLYHLLQDKNSNYAATEFSEGGVLQIELAAKIAGREEDKDNCAEAFLAFLISPQAQKEIVSKNIMLPVIAAETEPHFDALKAKQMRTKALDTLNLSGEQMKRWIEQWQRALSR